MSDDDTGFPKGVSIKLLNVCKSDMRCLKVPSPYYYTDRVANSQRLLNNLKSRNCQNQSSLVSTKKTNSVKNNKTIFCETAEEMGTFFEAEEV